MAGSIFQALRRPGSVSLPEGSLYESMFQQEKYDCYTIVRFYGSVNDSPAVILRTGSDGLFGEPGPEESGREDSI